MARNKQRASKKKRCKFNKNNRNCYEVKSSPAKSVISTESLPDSSDAEGFINVDLNETASESCSQNVHYLDAQKSSNSKESKASSKLESSPAGLTHFSFKNRAGSSESTTVPSTTERESIFVQIDAASESFTSEHAYFFRSRKTNSSKCVVVASNNGFEYFFLARDKGRILKDAIIGYIRQDTDDSSKSMVVTNNGDKSKSLNNDQVVASTKPKLGHINACLSQDITNSSESTIKTIEGLRCLNDGVIEILCQNSTTGDKLRRLEDDIHQDLPNSFVSTVIKTRYKFEPLNDIIDSLCEGHDDCFALHIYSILLLDSLIVPKVSSKSPSIKGNDKLNRLPAKINSGSKHSTVESVDPNEFSSTIISSTKVLSMKSSFYIPSIYKEMLQLFKLRKIQAQEKFIREKFLYDYLLSILERSVIFIIAKIKGRNFRKSKRNACIESIYKMKLEESIECLHHILSQTNDILNCLQKNYEIQRKKLVEVIEKFDTYRKIDFANDNWRILLEAIVNLKRMDQLKARQLGEKKSTMDQYFKKIVNLFLLLKTF